MKTLRIPWCLIVATVILAGCGPSSKQVASSAKASLQEYLDSSQDLKSLHLTVTDVTAIKVGENTYDGLASIRSPRGEHDVSLKITADGQNTIWSAEPGAFAPFLLEPNAAGAQDAPAASDIGGPEPPHQSPASWAIEAVQDTYAFGADQPDEVRHGSWTASQIPRDQCSLIQGDNLDCFIVHYSVPERGLDCQWELDFPASEWRAYTPRPTEGCALAVFQVK